MPRDMLPAGQFVLIVAIALQARQIWLLASALAQQLNDILRVFDRRRRKADVSEIKPKPLNMQMAVEETGQECAPIEIDSACFRVRQIQHVTCLANRHNAPIASDSDSLRPSAFRGSWAGYFRL